VEPPRPIPLPFPRLVTPLDDVVTVNEQRAALNLPSIEGGDVTLMGHKPIPMRLPVHGGGPTFEEQVANVVARDTQARSERARAAHARRKARGRERSFWDKLFDELAGHPLAWRDFENDTEEHPPVLVRLIAR
jgi:hypothetical protein